MFYKAEMWDKMQDIMARYNDHMTHYYLQFDRQLNVQKMKEAVAIATNSVPILKSKFVNGLVGAKWKAIDDFDFDDVYNFVELKEDKLSEVSEKFLLGIIDETKEAQIKFLHARYKDKDAISFLMNHQTMDGADLKEFFGNIAKIYTDLLESGKSDVRFKSGDRSDEQLFADFTDKEKEEIDNLISYSKKQKSKIAFPFEKASKKDWYPKINKLNVSAGTFAKLKANGKKLGVSINDILLGAFYRTTVSMVNLKEGETLGLPNMVNLRRYIKSGESQGFCNLTSMVVANLGEKCGGDIFETVARCKLNMDKLKDNYPGLHGLALLRKVFKYAPYSVAKFLIGTFFKNPLIGISNIGIVDEKQTAFGDAVVEDIVMTGSVKYPPYMQLALITYKNEMRFTVANYGTDKDHEMFAEFFRRFDDELNTFAKADVTAEFAKEIWRRSASES